MNRLILLLLSMLFFVSGKNPVMGQQELSLDACIEIALERNFSLRIVRNQEGIAENNYSRGNAGLLPSLDLRSSFGGNLNTTNQQLNQGGESQARGIHNTSANMGLQAGWMLFDGFRGQIRYRQLEELMQLSALNTRISVENIVAQLASEYYFYIQQKQLFTNLQYAVDLSRERVRIEQEHFLLGSGSKVQLLQAEVNLNADSSRLERQYEVLSAASVRLAEVMGLEDLNREFAPADTSITLDTGLVYDELMADVMSRNAAVLAARQEVSLSSKDLQLARSQRYPYLNLATGYGYTHNTYQSGSVSDQQTWGMNYSLTLGLNLYDGRNQQRREKNARVARENSELEFEQIRQEVMADFITIFNAYDNNLRLLNLETQNLDVARENLDIAFERYRLGGLSGFELREVQKNLLEAEERLLSIQYQAKMAEISLMQISGQILE